MSKKYKIATILIHYNEPAYCINITKDLLKLSRVNNRIIIVDNFSEEKNYSILLNKLCSNKIDIIRNEKNIGFGGGVNFGANYAKKYSPEYLHIINTDTKVINYKYLSVLESVIEKNKDFSIVGPAILKKNNEIQNTIMPFPSLKSILFFKKHFKKESFLSTPYRIKEVKVVNGVCFLTRFKDFKNVNGFDEDYFMYVEEQDYAYKISKLGKKSAFVSVKSIVHYGENKYTSKIDWKYYYTRKNQILFLHKRKKHFSAIIVALLFSFAIIKKYIINHYNIENNSLKASLIAFWFPRKNKIQL